ncbi:MAG TPA: rhodanese-like domain-containing protein [Nocardioidaceae bacterium]|nr:rhodanese-like domain-containing protein [Nocardioidaceae bacterium]
MRSALRAVVLLSLLLAVLGVASCGSSEADGTVVKMPTERAVAGLDAGKYTVIDLRSPEAFRAGHVVGAVNIDASAPEFEQRVRRLDETVEYLVYAVNEKQSGPAADQMVRLGLERVVDAGGFGTLAIAGAEIE